MNATSSHAAPAPIPPVRIALVGAGGYGEWYLRPLLSQEQEQGFRLVAVIDPVIEGCSRLAELRARETPLFPTLEAFFQAGSADLVILASPIQFHCAQTGLALAHGCHVLCEKPLCSSLEEIESMRAAEAASGKTVTIGYQWSFSAAIQRLKHDILAGRLGRPVRLRTLVCWPRDEAYYRRNGWAGRMRTQAGAPVFDSPVNNATAHFLHNALYVLGGEIAESALPRRVEAELWRANAIENYDTAALRLEMAGGTEVLFYTSHAVEALQGPIFDYRFERGSVAFDSRNSMVATLSGGETIDYGSPDEESYRKIWAAIASVRTGRAPICGIPAAAAHSRVMLQAQAAEGGIRDFPPALIRVDQTGAVPRRYVAGLMEAMGECYGKGLTFRGSGNPLFEAAAPSRSEDPHQGSQARG